MPYIENVENSGNVTRITPIARLANPGQVGAVWTSNGPGLDPTFQNVPALLAPYDPRTRPYYLDIFWQHFHGRPFGQSGYDGFTATQSAFSGNITLASASAQGTVLFTVGSGQGANFVVGEPIAIGDGGVNWQTFLITAVAGDTLTAVPAVAPSAGWPAGSYVTHAFGDSSHPAFTFAWYAMGAFIANSKQQLTDGQPSLLPPNGAGNGNDLGSMEDSYTDTNGVANVPHGWQSLGTGANIALVASGPWSNSGLRPQQRSGFGLKLAANTSPGGGVKTIVAIPVVPGRDYTLSCHAATFSGTAGFKIVLLDFNNPMITLATQSTANASAMNVDDLGVRTGFTFTAPPGTTAIQIQIQSQTNSDVTYVDDFRLWESRQSSVNNRYVFENPGNRPIVMFGDSYTSALGFAGFAQAIQARLGPGVNVLNYGLYPGETLANMLPGLPAALANNPAYLLLCAGFGGDLVGGTTLSALQGNLATLIDQCRQAGVIPVIAGIPPLSSSVFTNGLSICHTYNDGLRATCATYSQ